MTAAFLLPAAACVFLFSAPYLVRAVIGPTVFDRLAGLNAAGTNVGVLMVLIGAMYGRLDMFVDIALALFLLNLVATLLIARHLRDRARSEGKAA